MGQLTPTRISIKRSYEFICKFQDVAWVVEVRQLWGGQVRQRRGGGHRRHPAAEAEDWGEISVWQIHRWVHQKWTGLIVHCNDRGFVSDVWWPRKWKLSSVCSSIQRGVMLSYSSGVSRLPLAWDDERPECCDDVRSSVPGLRPPGPGRQLSADNIVSTVQCPTLGTGPSAIHPCPEHSEPVRQSQSSPGRIRVVNFIIDPSADEILWI